MTTADCILMVLFRPTNPDQLNPVLIQILTIQILVYSPQAWRFVFLKHRLFLLYANNTFKGDKIRHTHSQEKAKSCQQTEVLFSIFHQISRWNTVMQSTLTILLEARHGWKGFHSHAAELCSHEQYIIHHCTTILSRSISSSSKCSKRSWQ